MAEPIPTPSTEIPKPQQLIVGETPVYLTAPMRIGGKDVSSFVIQPGDKRGMAGIDSGVVLIKEASRKKGEEGMLVDKPLIHVDPMDEVSWDKISGIQWTDETGVTHTIPKDQLSLTTTGETPNQTISESINPESASPEQPTGEALPASEAPADIPAAEAAVPQPEIPPVEPSRARDVLSTLTEDPSTITIVGLRAYETRALDLADRSMQRMVSPHMAERSEAASNLWVKTKEAARGVHEFLFTTIWKQSIGGIYFHERAREYYMDMLKAAETPFAEEAIRLAEARAADRYNKKLADSNFLVSAGTRAVDWLRDKLGMRTSIQQMALEEIGVMKTQGEIKGMEAFDREAAAVRARFSQDFENADQYVRKQLGEKLEILNPEKDEHRPIVEGVQNLLKRYATGEIADKAEFDKRTKEFFAATLKNVRPDIFAEAELYSSSLYDVAETLRAKMSHEGGIANIDNAIAGLQMRLGMAQMGEVTSLEPTAVERGIGKVREVFEWLNKKNVLVPMVFNEAAIGGGIALALSAANFLKTAPFRAVSAITGPLGSITGGALAGGLFAGWREYGQLQRDYLTHLRERESGANFTESMKRRSWFERFSVKQRDANEMMGTIENALYENGTLKATMTDDELRTAFATVADLQARKAVSEVGPKRIGLVRYSNRELIESERAALDVVSNKALSDLDAYLAAHADQADAVLGGNTFGDFMVKLTTSQTQVLKEGISVMESFDDPVKATLGVVSGYAPEIDIVKRRFPFAGKDLPEDAKALGMDAILDEFKKEARAEAIRYGVRAGIIGAGVGAAFEGIRVLAGNVHIGNVGTEQASNATPAYEAGSKTMTEVTFPTQTHTIPINGHNYTVPSNLSITEHTVNGTTTYDATITPERGADIELAKGLKTDELFKRLHDVGLNKVDARLPGEVPLHDVKLDGISYPDGTPIQIRLPDGYHMDFVKDHQSWQIIDDKTNQSVTSLQFDRDGRLLSNTLNHDGLRALDAHGIKVETPQPYKTVDIPRPGAEVVGTGMPVAPVGGVESAAPVDLSRTFTVKGDELGNGGIWDYFLGKSHDATTTNAMKNLFRIYTHDNQSDVIKIPDASPHAGYFDSNAPADHFRQTVFGDQKVTEININKLPNDAQLNLPEKIFGQNGIDNFKELNTKAVADYQKFLATPPSGEVQTPNQVIEYMYQQGGQQKLEAIALKLGYVGHDSALPSNPGDLNMMYSYLANGSVTSSAAQGAGTTAGNAAANAVQNAITEPKDHVQLYEMVFKKYDAVGTPAQIVATPGVHYIPIREAVPAAAVPDYSDFAARHTAEAGLKTAVENQAWFPIFIPYREVLEMAPVAVEAAATPETMKAERILFSPFGMEQGLLSEEAVKNRLSPRLKEQPNATLNQREEVSWYLSGLPESEAAVLAELTGQIGKPINPGTRAVIVMPTLGGTASIYDRLTQYVGQTNPDGTPFDMNQAEIIVYDSMTAHEIPGASVKTDVEKFLGEHPDMAVHYMSHSYETPPSAGQIKRDAANAALSRIGTLPEDAKDAIVIADNGGNRIAPSYLSASIAALDADPAIDMVAGEYRLNPEAYHQFPMLFAQHRAFEVFDALVRHGESDHIPGIISGNNAVRAATLAGIGGYNANAPVGEDREMAWMIKTARGTDSDTVRLAPDMMATIDPTETAYRMLQHVGVADHETPLAANETYNSMPWNEMAEKATQAYTPESLEADIDAFYQSVYPSLKSSNPQRFDAYFKRTMDTLGIQYEVTEDGHIRLTNTETLGANMAADINLEEMAKTAAGEVVAATPRETPVETPRESLEQLAGTEAGTPLAETTEMTPQETMASGISSPDIGTEAIPTAPEAPLTAAPEQPVQPAQNELSPEKVARVEGVENRVNYVLEKTKGSEAAVAVTPGELMDYLKTRLEMAGNTRIVGGNIKVEGNTVSLTDMKAKSMVGEVTFNGKMIEDPQKGLVVDPDSISYHLPLLMRIFEGRIKDQLGHFDQALILHMGQRIPSEWKADRADIKGGKLEIRFSKSPGTNP